LNNDNRPSQYCTYLQIIQIVHPISTCPLSLQAWQKTFESP
jgi:hypothetical protein